jgi:hypothetical protein
MSGGQHASLGSCVLCNSDHRRDIWFRRYCGCRGWHRQAPVLRLPGSIPGDAVGRSGKASLRGFSNDSPTPRSAICRCRYTRKTDLHLSGLPPPNRRVVFLPARRGRKLGVLSALSHLLAFCSRWFAVFPALACCGLLPKEGVLEREPIPDRPLRLDRSRLLRSRRAYRGSAAAATTSGYARHFTCAPCSDRRAARIATRQRLADARPYCGDRCRWPRPDAQDCQYALLILSRSH